MVESVTAYATDTRPIRLHALFDTSKLGVGGSGVLT